MVRSRGLLSVAVVVLVGGLSGLGFGASRIWDYGAEDWIVRDQTNGTLHVGPEHAPMEFGWTVFVRGEWEDLDQDGRWDICDQVNISVEPTGGGTGFVYTTSGNREATPEPCHTDWEGDTWEALDGGQLIQIGIACEGCSTGLVQFNASQPIHILDINSLLDQLTTGLTAGGIGLAATCCGGVLLLVWLILGVLRRPGGAGGVDLAP